MDAPDGPRRGSDLRTEVRLTLEEAAKGTKKDVPLEYTGPCEDCGGTGAEDGSLSVCGECRGSGQVAHSRGPFLLQTPCPACRGAGSSSDTPCPGCRGSGETPIERAVKVSFPEGIDTGQTLRLPGQGLPGFRGGPAGHLYVEVDLEQHDRFERDGDDLVHGMVLTYPEVALGTTRDIDGLDGEPITVKIPAGTQPGEVVSIHGAGMPRLQRAGQGKLLIIARVGVPKKLSRKAKKLLEQLGDEIDS